MNGEMRRIRNLAINEIEDVQKRCRMVYGEFIRMSRDMDHVAKRLLEFRRVAEAEYGFRLTSRGEEDVIHRKWVERVCCKIADAVDLIQNMSREMNPEDGTWRENGSMAQYMSVMADIRNFVSDAMDCVDVKLAESEKGEQA